MITETLMTDKAELESKIKDLVTKFANDYKEFDVYVLTNVDSFESVIHDTEPRKHVNVNVELSMEIK